MTDTKIEKPEDEKTDEQEVAEDTAAEADSEETTDDQGAEKVVEAVSEEAANDEGGEKETPEEKPEEKPTNGIDPQHIRLVEALLFASSEPLTERLLKNRLPNGASLKAILKHLQKDFENRGVQLVQRGKTWAFRTAPDLTTLLNKEIEVPRKLSRAAIETMAIIAYHQPVTRGEIEEIRGVTISRGTIDILLELGWIGPRGRREVPGRPMTWGTTDAFLDHFGIESRTDLPGMQELKDAGLLDASPAIQVYRSQVNSEGEEQGVLPIEGMNEDETEPPEPLNPEG